MIDPEGGVSLGILLSAQSNKVIMVKNIAHPQPMWKIPGGTVETKKGEVPMDALYRELEEETGIRPDKGNVRFLMRVLAKSRTLHYFHVYVAFVEDFSDLNYGPTMEDDGATILIAQEFTVDEILSSKNIVLPHHLMMFKAGIEELQKQL